MKFTRHLILVLAALPCGGQGVSMQKEKPPVSKNTRATDKEAMKDAAATALTDINRATLEELKAIPEIGEEYAAAVVKGRPYKNKGQLVARKVLPEGIYKKIKERIVARP